MYSAYELYGQQRRAISLSVLTFTKHQRSCLLKHIILSGISPANASAALLILNELVILYGKVRFFPCKVRSEFILLFTIINSFSTLFV
jgi:hypothetical protein